MHRVLLALGQRLRRRCSAQPCQGLDTPSKASGSSSKGKALDVWFSAGFLSSLCLWGEGKASIRWRQKKGENLQTDLYHVSQLNNYILLHNLPSRGLRCLSICKTRRGRSQQIGLQIPTSLLLEKHYLYLFPITRFCMSFHQTKQYLLLLLLLRKKRKSKNLKPLSLSSRHVLAMTVLYSHGTLQFRELGIQPSQVRNYQ